MARRFCDLPEEVLEEILSWLLPKSLTRCKCVNKSWYALINSLVKNPVFVNKHLHNIDKKILSSTTCLVFSCHRTGYCPDPALEILGPFELYSSITISNDACENDRLKYISEDFDVPIISGIPDMSCVVGVHCNGIICLSDFGKTIMLCNPAINEYRTLPKPGQAGDDFTSLGVGFGYDSRASDYKVVKFGVNMYWNDMLKHLKAEVYSLGSDSWREIGIDMKLDGFPFVDNELFCKGIFYWSMQANGEQMIISFNMSDEVFHHVPLPNNIQKTEKQIKLAVWNESVTLFSFPRKRRASISIELWVMEDCLGGVKGSFSWIKKLTIGPLMGTATPLTFWKNDELLMETTDGGLLSYNLRSQMRRNLTIQGVEYSRFKFFYVKSLLSVQGGNKAR